MIESEKKWCTCVTCLSAFLWTKDEYQDQQSCPRCKSYVWVVDEDGDESRSQAIYTRKVLGLPPQ